MALVYVPVNARGRTDSGYSMRRVQQRAGTPNRINSSYRSISAQEDLFFDNYTRVYAISAKYDRKVYKGVAYWRKQGNTVSVAVPGSSKHNYGLAYDVDQSSPLQGTLINKGKDHGMKRTLMVKPYYEPWHWEYRPEDDKWRTNIRSAEAALNVSKTENWGKSFDMALRALRAGARGWYGSTKAEREYLQRRVGVDDDGIIGPATKRAITEHVKHIQQNMKNLGLYSGKIDGHWGAATENAYTSFRRIGYTP
jgi:hypothetical protein